MSSSQSKNKQRTQLYFYFLFTFHFCLPLNTLGVCLFLLSGFFCWFFQFSFVRFFASSFFFSISSICFCFFDPLQMSFQRKGSNLKRCNKCYKSGHQRSLRGNEGSWQRLLETATAKKRWGICSSPTLSDSRHLELIVLKMEYATLLFNNKRDGRLIVANLWK